MDVDVSHYPDGRQTLGDCIGAHTASLLMCGEAEELCPAGRVSRSDFHGSATSGRMREPRVEASMIRYLFVLALTLAVLPAVAYAQGGGAQGHMGTPEQQRACRSDVQRFCREMQNQGDYAIADCLKANTRRLSSACRRVIEAGSR
jgi:Cysteine rich repeat